MSDDATDVDRGESSGDDAADRPRPPAERGGDGMGGRDAESGGDGKRGGDAEQAIASRRAFLGAAATSAAAGGVPALATGQSTETEAAQSTATETAGDADLPVAPCRVQAEDFDAGGEGVAYHEASPAEGPGSGDYRDASVDLQRIPSGGYAVGWIEAGEWWEYTVEVPEADQYEIALRIAAVTPDATATVRVDGEQVGSLSDPPAPGNFQAWVTESVGTVRLSPGEHTIRVTADAGGWHCNWIEVAPPPEDDGYYESFVYTGGFELTALSKTQTSVTLLWEHGDDLPGVYDSFVVRRDGETVVETGDDRVTVDDLDPGTSYEFEVSASAPVTDTPRQVETLTVRTPEDPDERPPEPPRNFTVEAEQTPRIDCSWEHARDRGGSGLDHYVVSLDGEPVREVGSFSTSVSLTDVLETGREYEVALTAVDAAGNESDPVVVQTATDESVPDGVPAEPTPVTAEQVAPTRVRFSWDLPPADDLSTVQVRWEDLRPADALPDGTEPRDGSITYAYRQTEHTLDDLVPGATYRLEVKLTDVDDQETEWVSAEITLPAGPSNATVRDVEDGSLTVAWDRPGEGGDESDLAAYEVRVDGERVARVPPDRSTADVSGLSPGTRHDVTIVGVDEADDDVGGASLTTRIAGSDDAGVRAHYLAELDDRTVDETPIGEGDDGATITVEGDRVRVEGRRRTASTGCHALRIAGARFDGATLTLALEEVPTDGDCADARRVIDYRAGTVLESPPERVLVEYRGDFETIWQAEGSDALVRVDPETDVLDEGDTTEALVSLSGIGYGFATDNLGEYEVTLRVESPDVVDVGGASLPFHASGSADVESGDGYREVTIAGTSEPGSNSGRNGDTTLGTVQIEGAGRGEALIDVTDVTVTVRDGQDLNVGGAAQVVSVDGEGPPLVGEDGPAPTDPDDDGLYEDVNGNGEGDLADAVDLFQHRESDAVTNHADAYDFSGNDELDLADVVQLFRENTS